MTANTGAARIDRSGAQMVPGDATFRAGLDLNHRRPRYRTTRHVGDERPGTSPVQPVSDEPTDPDGTDERDQDQRLQVHVDREERGRVFRAAHAAGPSFRKPHPQDLNATD